MSLIDGVLGLAETNITLRIKLITRCFVKMCGASSGLCGRLRRANARREGSTGVSGLPRLGKGLFVGRVELTCDGRSVPAFGVHLFKLRKFGRADDVAAAM